MTISPPSEQPTPDLSSNFRSAMRRLASTVCIVTCADEDGWYGMTATAVTSVCAAPPAMLVCVNTAVRFYRYLSSSETFCINVLGNSHTRISQGFGGQLKGAARFEAGDWMLARRLPFLMDAQANVFCKTESRMQFGTHCIFVGCVQEARFSDRAEPLIYQDGQYVTTSSLLGG
jgi:flavin reductase